MMKAKLVLIIGKIRSSKSGAAWLYMRSVQCTVIAIATTCILAGCKGEYENPADVVGTRQNVCMNAALEKAKTKHNTSYTKLIPRDTPMRHVFIGAVDFSFLTDEKLTFRDIYPPKVLSNGEVVPRPGIVASSRTPMRELKELYPDVVLTEIATQTTSLVVMLTCWPDLVSAPGSDAARSKFYPYLNSELGVYESKNFGQVNSVPIAASSKYPDGTVVWVNCNINLTKTCHSSFVIVPGVLVQYRYPVEQRADWERIKELVLTKLNNSIIQ